MDNMNHENRNNENIPVNPYNERPVYVENTRPAEPASGKAVASLVLGICSIVFCCSGIIGIVCAIIDLVLSSQLKKEVAEVPSMGKVGKTLGIVGLILGILGILFWIAYFIILIVYGTWEVTYY